MLASQFHGVSLCTTGEDEVEGGGERGRGREKAAVSLDVMQKHMLRCCTLRFCGLWCEAFAPQLPNARLPVSLCVRLYHFSAGRGKVILSLPTYLQLQNNPLFRPKTPISPLRKEMAKSTSGDPPDAPAPPLPSGRALPSSSEARSFSPSLFTFFVFIAVCRE